MKAKDTARRTTATPGDTGWAQQAPEPPRVEVKVPTAVCAGVRTTTHTQLSDFPKLLYPRISVAWDGDGFKACRWIPEW